MTQPRDACETVPRGSAARAVVRIVGALVLLMLVVVGASHRSDATFGYLGGLTGIVALERRFVWEQRSAFFDDEARAIDLVLAALIGGAIALLLW